MNNAISLNSIFKATLVTWSGVKHRLDDHVTCELFKLKIRLLLKGDPLENIEYQQHQISGYVH